jgi:ketosteroid isomerase-like protein
MATNIPERRVSNPTPPETAMPATMTATAANLEQARRYIDALARGETGDALAAFFTPDAVVIEFPNRFTPAGARRELPQLREAAERGQRYVRDQEWRILSELADGDRVALELDWAGTIAVDVGPLAAGTRMRAHVAVFLEFRDGRIAAQRHYDCYEPF